MDILCVGDSLTYGYNVPVTQNWLTVAAAETGHTLKNYGMCGDTTVGMKARLTGLLPTAAEDAVFLMGGTNDLIMGITVLSVWKTLQSMAVMVRQAHKRVLWGVPPLTMAASVLSGWQSVTQVEKTNGAIIALRRHILIEAKQQQELYLDCYETLQGRPMLYEDGLHPNREGYASIGKAAGMAWKFLK